MGRRRSADAARFAVTAESAIIAEVAVNAGNAVSAGNAVVVGILGAGGIEALAFSALVALLALKLRESLLAFSALVALLALNPMDPVLEILHQNARLPHEEIARLLNLPIAEVEQRIRNYEDEGVILAYQAVVDPEKIDADSVTAFIEVSITPERGGGFDRLALRIARFDEVKSCWLMSGGYDLAVMVEGQNLREIARFVSEKLSTVEGVISTATRFRLKTYKQNGVMLGRSEAEERLPVTP